MRRACTPVPTDRHGSVGCEKRRESEREREKTSGKGGGSRGGGRQGEGKIWGPKSDRILDSLAAHQPFLTAPDGTFGQQGGPMMSGISPGM